MSGSAWAKNLTGPQIMTVIGGKKVYLSTPYGLQLPLKYLKNGQVKGDASGFSLAGMIAPRERGKWWVEGGRMCQKWPTWYDGKTFCFTLEKTGAKTLDWTRDDGMTGTARIAN